MNLVDKGLSRYSEDHTTRESPLLEKINRDTHAEVTRSRMLSGHLQGRLLSMISRMVRPKIVIEIGTYTGYSALCLAEGLAPGGKVITIDNNDELEERVRNYIRQAGEESRVDFRIGNALQLVGAISEIPDLVFIDADKENYCRYYDILIDRLTPGGYIIADNVLWSGKVLDERPDKDTRAILEFNQKVHNDNRVENVLVPVRDGLMICRKL